MLYHDDFSIIGVGDERIPFLSFGKSLVAERHGASAGQLPQISPSLPHGNSNSNS